MTVYVDDFGIPARVSGIKGRWSHLIADTEDELHAFAARLGLRREWFQDPRIVRKGPFGPAQLRRRVVALRRHRIQTATRAATWCAADQLA